MSSNLDWFLDARFGVSIHWGPYSIPARGEWVRSSEQISPEDYDRYAREFNPDRYDPNEWAALIRASGGKYAVLTAKHHDGFCLWDTATTDFKSRTDLIRPFLEAMRAEGLRVGVYFSLLDWHHPDFPHYGDRQHPERFNPKWQGHEHDWDRFLDYSFAQLRELLTQYGKLDQLVLDFSYWNFIGEGWRATELVKMIRELQPGIILNDRLGGDIKGHPKPWVGDYDSPELNVPREPVTNARGERVPFETWITLNNSWGYSASDHHYKSPTDVIRALVNCVSKGGNLLVNLSPDGRGQIPDAAHDILYEVGDWLDLNGESIYGCRDAELPKPEWGRWTACGDRLYAHFLEQPLGHANLPGLRGKVGDARLVATGAEAFLSDFWNFPVQNFDGPEDIFLNWARPTQATFPLPDARDTVVRLRLLTKAEQAKAHTQLENGRRRLDGREPFA